MKQLITKANVLSYCEMLEKSIDQFTDYCEEYPVHTKYGVYYLTAKWVKQNYRDKIGLHILSFASSGTPYFLEGKPSFPGGTLDALQHIGWFIFDISKQMSPLDLQEQNQKSKEHVHFDFSVKKIKTINDLLRECL